MNKVIAEIGSCQGDLALAIDTAQAALEAGAWMVKGQFYRADTLTTRTAESYGQGITEPVTQYEAFQHALTYEQWATVARTIGPDRFFASVFDLEACRDYPYGWIKIASADITYRQLIEAAAQTDARLIISTGAATADEIQKALTWIRKVPLLLVCTLCYPCPPGEAHLARLHTLRRGFSGSVGYSDHTRGISVALHAFANGAEVVEKHFTITPGAGGDHDFAITPDELHLLATADLPDITPPELMGDPSFIPHPCEIPARTHARRSVCARVDIPAGTRITADMVAVLRPGTGLPPAVLVSHHIGASGSPVGQLAQVDIPAGTPLVASMFGGVRFSLTVE